MTNPLSTVVRELRALTPSYPLADYQAESLAERQATKLLELLEITKAPVDVSRVAELPRLEVVVRTRQQIGGLSGLTEWSKGRWLIAINRDESGTRRRFTLAHELKHILDHPFMRVLYVDERGNIDDQRVESMCDYFAACVLMPRTWVKKAWTTVTQDQTELAALFRVSPAAMSRRLMHLGLTEPRFPMRGHESVARYFRSGVELPVAC
ncbi:ImmA/IrrE family metallo-endopeptidase [Amycolatopsis sp. NPDC051716]|uniref:ImmA/IrrE family metallo-endopeptidase n=1 Tax=Amycolatopsis sp. NPDC051716 TaxID=3155804 RepID=UPI003432CBB5